MRFVQFLKDMFVPKAQPPERVYPDRMWMEKVSKPGAAVKVHRIHLTKEQHEGLRANVTHLPGSSKPSRHMKP